MTDSENFFQGQQPAAILKHAVLREYFNVFAGMVGKGYRGHPLWLIDGYAGPGRYDAADGLDPVNGSPLIAVALARDWRNRAEARDIRCAFIERDPRHATALIANIQPFVDAGIRATVLQGEAKDRLPQAWNMVGQDPVVTFLDPFGVAMPRELVTGMLLARQSPPSEVLLNINVEAVSRLGGLLQRAEDGSVQIKPNCFEKGVERADEFLGGDWWRSEFLDARLADGSAARAAERVVAAYCAQVSQATGASSMSVPIRRQPTGPVLFLLTLFFRHEAAGYKFADAAARANRKWREAFRQLSLSETLADEKSMFEGMGTMIREVSAKEALAMEKSSKAAWVAQVVDNLCDLLDTRTSVQIGSQISAILGSTLSLAGESEVKLAWDRLTTDQLVQPRDTGRDLWRQTITRR